MAKRKKGSKVQGRAKLRRANSAKRSKVRKAAKAAKRMVAKAKPKRAPVKKAARKVKRPVAPVGEMVAAEVIEQAAPGQITAFGAIALTGFVLAGNTLLRPLVNAINRTPINQGTTE